MRLDQKYSGNVFILSSDDYEASKAVIYGMPMNAAILPPADRTQR